MPVTVHPAPANGTSDVTRVWVPASDFFVNFGTPSQNGNVGMPNWLMDAASAEAITGSCLLPSSWSTVNVFIWWANVGAGVGDVVWDIRTEWYSPGETLSTSTAGGPSNGALTATAAAQNVIVRSLVASAAAVQDEILRIAATRRAAAAGDTLANDACFLGIDLVKVS